MLEYLVFRAELRDDKKTRGLNGEGEKINLLLVYLILE